MLSGDDSAFDCPRASFTSPAYPLVKRMARAMREICRSKKEQHVQQSDLSRDAHNRASYRRWNHPIHGDIRVHLGVVAPQCREMDVATIPTCSGRPRATERQPPQECDFFRAGRPAERWVLHELGESRLVLEGVAEIPLLSC
jgi:hypothetical protein